MNARSWTEHLLPALTFSSALFITEPLVPKPPPFKFSLVGLCFLLLYLMWTIVYDLGESTR